MYPILFLNIDSYSVLFGLGYLLAVLLAYKKVKKTNLDKSRFLIFISIITFFSILGARLFFALFEYYSENNSPPFAFFSNPLILFSSDGGNIIYGGLILGIISGIITAKKLKLEIGLIADISTPSIFLGIGIGRVGCFLNGCCFGTKTGSNHIFSVLWTNYKQNTGAYCFYNNFSNESFSIINTQLISSFFAFTMFLLFTYLYKKDYFKKALLPLGFLIYSIFRFFIEFFRADNEIFIFSLTLSQIISFFIFFTALILLIKIIYYDRRKKIHI